jgi:hypothetical protein
MHGNLFSLKKMAANKPSQNITPKMGLASGLAVIFKHGQSRWDKKMTKPFNSSHLCFLSKKHIILQKKPPTLLHFRQKFCIINPGFLKEVFPCCP